MKNLKLITILLLLASMALSIVACKPAEESEAESAGEVSSVVSDNESANSLPDNSMLEGGALAGYTPSPFDLTKEEKEEFEKAFYKKCGMDEWEDRPAILYMNEEIYGEGAGQLVCYGKYNGCIISSDGGSVQQAVMDFYIGRYRFTNSTNNHISAYKDGIFYHIIEAYENGLLNDDDIEAIHEAYWRANGTKPVYLLENFDFTEKEKEDFERALNNEFGTILSPDSILGYVFDERGRIPIAIDGVEATEVCYGKYDGYIIFSLNIETDKPETDLYIGDHLFRMFSDRELKAYKDGKFVSLIEEYEKGNFTEEEFELFHQIYSTVHHMWENKYYHTLAGVSL